MNFHGPAFIQYLLFTDIFNLSLFGFYELLENGKAPVVRSSSEGGEW